MAFNPLICKFPTEYKGLTINTDFRVGILINQLFSNPSVSEDDKKIGALKLLYNDSIPSDIELAWHGIEWFMHVGYNKCTNSVETDEKTKENDDDDVETMKDDKGNDLLFDTNAGIQETLLDFDFDASRIYTAFLRTYNIDLETAELHFFKFMYMLGDLDSDTAHSKVVDIRSTSLKGMDAKRRSAYLKLKKEYEVPVVISDEDKNKLSTVGIDEDDLKQFMQF